MALKYSEFRKNQSMNNLYMNNSFISYKDYLEIKQIDQMIQILDICIHASISQKIYISPNLFNDQSVLVSHNFYFQREIDKLQCIVKYQNMSSKYSEFRKFVRLQRNDSQSSNNSITEDLNLQQINNMIDFLASPLKLSPKKMPYVGMAKKSPRKGLENNQIKFDRSRKNSQTNQTSDLATNVDSQTISSHHIEKLSPVHIGISRRHHTERQTPHNTIELSDMIDQTQSKICFDFEKDQYLLEANQQNEEIKNVASVEQLRSKMQQKLRNIQYKMNNKKINANQMENLLQKLKNLQDLIDKF